MNEHVPIMEVLYRGSQGVTRPFVCRGGDQNQYWVKGHGAGKRALCCEWIAGCLAQKLELPIPPFAQTTVSAELINGSMIPDIYDLGEGVGFGSKNVAGTQEISSLDIRRVDPALQLSVLLFDWWAQNLDRTLGAQGGNPNILWEVNSGRPWIIDHNLAFDADFSTEQLFSTHVFAAARRDASPETVRKTRERMRGLLPELEHIYLELPQEWLYLDAGLSDPTGFSLQSIRSILSRVETDFDRDWA